MLSRLAKRASQAPLYGGVHAVLATMHGKEVVIAPVLRDRLGLVVEIAAGIDTDTLGTFTGEISRQGNMLEAAIAKARLGMTAAGCEVGLASEGAFGPTAGIPFLAVGRELLVLVDDRAGIIISEMLVTDDIIFGSRRTKSGEDIDAWLAHHKFPLKDLLSDRLNVTALRRYVRKLPMHLSYGRPLRKWPSCRRTATRR